MQRLCSGARGTVIHKAACRAAVSRKPLSAPWPIPPTPDTDRRPIDAWRGWESHSWPTDDGNGRHLALTLPPSTVIRSSRVMPTHLVGGIPAHVLAALQESFGPGNWRFRQDEPQRQSMSIRAIVVEE